MPLLGKAVPERHLITVRTNEKAVLSNWRKRLF
jgi:hypothetical protein